ncbi:LysR family transcriptional regulator [Tropicimonas sp. IMCC6043]|uniref:LysR family transcriptional regulator n=1 Tax=Tropicimonas sp. IMCC6043 TaxID=2510645 RepID=UPI00101CFB90|nr:LysR family transcriptional regulator [Tropicimonas sp. IMCC6043]RYH09615.1 LysR family transcriptional regulator [Tropicimonas sp. IMCC6043]
MPRTTELQTTHRVLEWNDLAVILAIGRSGSLSGAARSLGKTHSTVFRRIKAIEEKVGVRFFDAFDSGYVPTDAGRSAIACAERIEGEVHALGIEVLGLDEKLGGRVRVTCPEAFAEDHAPGLMAGFIRRHPEIRIDVSPGHGAVDLNRREAEIAIRATRKPPDTAFGRKICPFRFALYASPDYIGNAPEQPLADHPFCMIEGTVNWLIPTIWKTREDGEDRAVFQCRASRAVQNAAAEGLGLTCLPCYVGDPDPRLVRVSDPIESIDMDLWVITHPELRNTARVRSLMAFLYEELAAQADLWGGRTTSTGAHNLLRRKGWDPTARE